MIMAALGSRDPPRPPDPPSAGAGSRAGVTSININITLLTSINTSASKSFIRRFVITEKALVGVESGYYRFLI